jgi:hypothetical protein
MTEILNDSQLKALYNDMNGPPSETFGPITHETVGKVAGVLETKWTEMSEDNGRLKTENQSLRVSLDLMTNERDYWRDRAVIRENERDKANIESEYMLKQWLAVYAIAEETKKHVIESRKTDGSSLQVIQKASTA